MISRKLLFFPPVILGILILVFFVGNRKAPVQNPPAELARHIRVIEVELEKFLPRVVGYGTVKPARVWNAVAQVSGQIEYVHPSFKKGAILPANTEIVRISDTDYTIAVKQAEANIRSAKARLKELEITEQNNKDALKIEEKSLSIKQQELGRKQELLKRGTIAQASLDQEQRDLLNQEKRVLDLKNSLKLLPTQREVQKEQLEVYETQLETAKLNKKRTSIRLPFAARISEANVEVTQYVGVGTMLGAADGLKTAEISAQVPLSNLTRLMQPYLKNEQTATVSREAFEALRAKIGLYAIVRLNTGLKNVEWKAVVSRTSDTIDPKTRAIGIIITVEDHYKKVIPGERPPLVKGMFVEVELRTLPLEGQLVVPRSAVHDNQLYLLNNENRLEIRPVNLSFSQGNLAVISGGLKAGEKVVVSDLTPAIPNMLLKHTTDKELMKRIKSEAVAEGDAK